MTAGAPGASGKLVIFSSSGGIGLKSSAKSGVAKLPAKPKNKPNANSTERQQLDTIFSPKNTLHVNQVFANVQRLYIRRHIGWSQNSRLRHIGRHQRAQGEIVIEKMGGDDEPVLFRSDFRSDYGIEVLKLEADAS